MPAFRRLHPQLRIEFLLSTERMASLDDGADVAIASGDLPSSSLVARRIASSRWIICASPAQERGLPASQIALAWMLRNPAIAAPIVGATKLDHLDDAVAALSIALSSEDIDHLEEPYQPRPLAPQLT
jgi:DNA-binding transcriptional LysR family regulator